MLYVVMTDLFDLRWRPKALAINGVVWLFGTSLGPIMGGGFSTHVSWRWIFWIVQPINCIAILLVAAFLKIPHSTTVGASSQCCAFDWRNLDYIGAALAVAALSSFLIPITWAGTMYAWSSWHTWWPLTLGILGLAGLVLYEAFLPKHPILPFSVLNDRTVAISFVHTFIIGFIQFGLIFYLPLYYQIVQGYSPLICGIALLPETLLSGPTTMIAGILVSKFGKYKFIILVGWAVIALGCGILILLDATSSIAQWIFLNVPAGIGLGILFPATAIAVQAPVDESNVAIASGLTAFARTIGQAVGIAIGNAVMSNQLQAGLEKATSTRLRTDAHTIAKNFASTKSILMLTSEGGAMPVEVISAYVKALQCVWWLLFAVSCCGLLTAFFIQDVGLDRTQAAESGEKSKTVDEAGGWNRPSESEAVCPTVTTLPALMFSQSSFHYEQYAAIAE